MTLYEFNILSLEEKQATVWKDGLFLDNYITKDVKINCYAIKKFFAEVHYDAQHNTITNTTAFKSGHELDKYSNLGKDNWDKGDIALVIFMVVSTVLGLAFMR
tara:strand:- start:331 stop:639 length:309 start_codon:yes stop_codon:yes gene_type:complete